MMEATNPDIDALLGRIRSSVREAHTYTVDLPPGIEVKVNQNESPFDLPAELKETILERIEGMPWNRYPSEFADRLRGRIAEANGVSPEAVLVGNGSNELTYLLGLALLEPGDPVVLPSPMFSLYEKVAQLHDAEVVRVGPRDDLGFDADGLVRAVREHRPPLTVLTTPNNPTGRAMRPGEIRDVVEASEDGFVVVDEAYIQFTEYPSAVALIEDHPQVLVLRTFSKGYGLAGLRVGYMIGRPDVMDELYRARLPFMIDPLAEEAACALLENRELLEDRIRQLVMSREQLFAALSELEGVEPVPSESNFVIFRTNLDSEALVEKLADRNVLIRDVSGYPELDRFVRVNAGAPEENKAFLAALKKALETREHGS